MLTYDFMLNAFAASAIVAVVAGIVGYFLVLRGQTFAGHALSHVGFAGATGAVLLGIPAIWGLVGFTLIAGLGMGVLGERISGRDVAIGVVLSLSIGLGVLFLHFYTAYATQVTALLFGNVLGVNRQTLWTLLGLAIVSLAGLALIARPLLFASLQPELAEAKGVSLQLVSLLFLAIVALTVAECAQIVGVLLVFTLDGGAGRRRRALDHAARPRRGPGRGTGAGRGLGRHRARLLHRLADQLLDHRLERRRLFCQSAALEQDASGMITRLLSIVLLSALLSTAAAATQSTPREFSDCAQCPEMVRIPAGKFAMGSPRWERGRFDSEGPQHEVGVRGFALSKYEITDAQFLTFLRETGYQPALCDNILRLGWRSPGGGVAFPPVDSEASQSPATCLNWYDAQAYIAWLNAKLRAQNPEALSAGGPYRLPTEAEWEYAARAGTTTSRWWGDLIGSGNANCNGCGSRWDGLLIAPVGSFGPNGFGLYDMLGNVWQWTDDCWNESYVGAPGDGRAWKHGDCTRRVLRGGSWSNVPEFLRSAARIKADAAGRDFDYSNYAGFRVARSLE